MNQRHTLGRKLMIIGGIPFAIAFIWYLLILDQEEDRPVLLNVLGTVSGIVVVIGFLIQGRTEYKEISPPEISVTIPDKILARRHQQPADSDPPPTPSA